jgi:hypothetical protein
VPDLTRIDWGNVDTIAAHTERFLPYLERFIWGVTSLRVPYVIEGVDFLPEQALARRSGSRKWQITSSLTRRW